MKKGICFVAACVLLTACTVIDQFTNELGFTLTREAVPFAADPVWVSGDAVKVLSSTRPRGNTFALNSGARSARGGFSGEKPGSAPLRAMPRTGTNRTPAILRAFWRKARQGREMKMPRRRTTCTVPRTPHGRMPPFCTP